MIQFFIDREPRYLHPVTGEVFTQEQMDKLEQERIKKDRKAGYRDRMVGYYDKWYRYNRLDNGKAYDEGSIEAANSGKCNGEMIIIPCIH